MKSTRHRSWTFQSRRAPKSGRRLHRPRLDVLEDRIVLASIWVGAYGYLNPQATDDVNAWSHPENWLGGVPGSGGTAEFTTQVNFTENGHTFTEPFSRSPDVDSGISVSIDVLPSWNGVITVDGGVSLTLTGSSVWQGGGIVANAAGATLSNSGSLTISSSNSINPYLNATLLNTGTIDFQGNGNFDGGTINNQLAAPSISKARIAPSTRSSLRRSTTRARSIARRTRARRVSGS